MSVCLEKKEWRCYYILVNRLYLIIHLLVKSVPLLQPWFVDAGWDRLKLPVTLSRISY